MNTVSTRQRARQEFREIIERIKNTEWEKMSKAKIDAYRAVVFLFKVRFGFTRPLLVAALYNELKKHASDRFALNLFQHYLGKAGKRYSLPLAGMKYISSNTAGLSPHGSLDIRYNDYAKGIRSEFVSKCRQVKRSGKKQEYSGTTLRVWDNGAISTYTVAYQGYLQRTTKGCEWSGKVRFYDRFDLNPRWNWSPSNNQGRSPGGERRTRIGYILNLGTDFDIYSVIAEASQGERDSEIDFGQMRNSQKRK